MAQTRTEVVAVELHFTAELRTGLVVLVLFLAVLRAMANLLAFVSTFECPSAALTTVRSLEMAWNILHTPLPTVAVLCGKVCAWGAVNIVRMALMLINGMATSSVSLARRSAVGWASTARVTRLKNSVATSTTDLFPDGLGALFTRSPMADLLASVFAT